MDLPASFLACVTCMRSCARYPGRSRGFGPMPIAAVQSILQRLLPHFAFLCARTMLYAWAAPARLHLNGERRRRVSCWPGGLDDQRRYLRCLNMWRLVSGDVSSGLRV